MRFLDRIRGERQPSVKTALFRLTEDGRAKLQEGFGGDAKTRILVDLECRGGSGDLDEIAEATKISRGQLEHLLPILANQGYIAVHGPGGDRF